MRELVDMKSCNSSSTPRAEGAFEERVGGGALGGGSGACSSCTIGIPNNGGGIGMSGTGGGGGTSGMTGGGRSDGIVCCKSSSMSNAEGVGGGSLMITGRRAVIASSTNFGGSGAGAGFAGSGGGGGGSSRKGSSGK